MADLVYGGLAPKDIARKLAPEDPKRRKLIRAQARRLIRSDTDFQQRVAMRAQEEMLVGLGPTIRGLLRRSSRGRTDAAKLILEASGFHNPRVKHEHSGDIKVSIDMPRPKAVESESGEDIPDADVVEEP